MKDWLHMKKEQIEECIFSANIALVSKGSFGNIPAAVNFVKEKYHLSDFDANLVKLLLEEEFKEVTSQQIDIYTQGFEDGKICYLPVYFLYDLSEVYDFYDMFEALVPKELQEAVLLETFGSNKRYRDDLNKQPDEYRKGYRDGCVAACKETIKLAIQNYKWTPYKAFKEFVIQDISTQVFNDIFEYKG